MTSIEEILYNNIRIVTKDFSDLLLTDLFYNGREGEADCRAWYSELQKMDSNLLYTHELVEYSQKRIALKQKLRHRHLIAFVALSAGFLLFGAGAVVAYAWTQNAWLSAFCLAATYFCCAASMLHANEVEVDIRPHDPNPFRRWVSNKGG